jgi:hypothetical protein
MQRAKLGKDGNFHTIMKSIKFSHRYTKLPGRVQHGSIVRLIEVLNSRFEDLHPAFTDYDTAVINDIDYPLPKKGNCLVLLFIGDGITWDAAELFTTVRRATPGKEMYYKKQRGEQMIVEIVE